MTAQLPAQDTLPGWSIRPATLDDTDVVVELRMAMGDELSAGRPQDFAPHVLAARRAQALAGNHAFARDHLGRDLSVWVAEADGLVVASAGIIWFRHPPSVHHPTGLEAYILNVYTRPEWRRKGIARALMETCLAAADAAGANRVWLRASEQGRPLYESMGFGPKNYLELAR